MIRFTDMFALNDTKYSHLQSAGIAVLSGIAAPSVV